MKKIIFISVFLFAIKANAQLIMDNNPYVHITEGACLIVDNTNANGIITQNPAGAGNIVSEAENNRVVWKIKNTTGTYTVPFTVSGTKIPLSVNVGTAGTANGDVIFSTYATANNNTPYPTGVTNMDYETGVNHSLNTIDRFWIIDATNYTTRPALSSIVFTYRDLEWAPSNAITEANLKAQRYNTTTNNWEYLIFLDGTDNSGANTVTTAAVTVSNFFKHWTLVDYTNPLPVELLSFTADCRDDEILLNWTTASESNNASFEVERSSNASDWQWLSTIAGAGNSNTPINYFAIDPEPFSDISYYRLKQIDFDGTYNYSPVVSASCNEETPFTVQVMTLTSSNELQLNFNVSREEEFIFSLYDMQGRQILETSVKTVTGANEIHISIQDVSEGIYLFALQNSEKFFGQKILLK